MLKNKPFWLSLALLAIYLLTGYFAVPPWLQPRLQQYLAVQLGRELHFEQLKFDPITWSVQLKKVELSSGSAMPQEQGLFPGTSLTADALEIRFNFWRLNWAISELKVSAPAWILDAQHPLMQSGPYPFFSLWQSYRTTRGSDFVPISRWRIEAGRMLVSAETSGPAQILLDEVFLKTGSRNAEGLREYSLALSTAEQAEIKVQAAVDLNTLGSAGRYQFFSAASKQSEFLNSPAATPADEFAGYRAEGAFQLTTQSDMLLIELTDSELSADSALRCVMDGFLCVSIYPVLADFEATIQAATNGVQLLSADAQLPTFELDAVMAQGSIELGRKLAIDSAQIKLTGSPMFATPGAGPDAAQVDHDVLDFDVLLQPAPGPVYQLHGQLDSNSGQVELLFSSAGGEGNRGELRLQEIAAQQAEATSAHPNAQPDTQPDTQPSAQAIAQAIAQPIAQPIAQANEQPRTQLDLLLENPAASLAKDFLTEHLSGRMQAASLQLRLRAILNDSGLSLKENISLQRVSLEPALSPADEQTLDSQWLLALLQNPQAEVSLELPERQLTLTEKSRLDTLLLAPIQPYLASMIEQPFTAIARQMGRESAELSVVRFESGSAELNADSSANLVVLGEALLQRPGLGIELAGVFDPLIDKKALQIEQIRTHIALSSAAELAFQSGSQAPDFNNPVVHSVIDEYARQRVPAKVLQAFIEHFGAADVDQGVIPEGDIAAYYAALFEVLVEYAEIPQQALSTLARFRAQTVMDTLTGQGVASERLTVLPQAQSSVAELAGVPLALAIRLHGGPQYSGLLHDSNPELELPQAEK